MRHLTDGEIRTYLDGESSSSAHDLAENHLADCSLCRERREKSIYDCQHGGQTVICPDTIANGSAGFL